MDFFEQSNQHLAELNGTEQRIFDYIMKNIQTVKDMSIRTLAEQCYVSPTTVIRLAKKLGFSGFREMSDALRLTCYQQPASELPEIFWKRKYGEDYTANIIESIRVVDAGQLARAARALDPGRTIYFLGEGLSRTIAEYGYKLFSSIGYRCVLLTDSFSRLCALPLLQDGDVLFAYSFTGRTREVIDFIEQASVSRKITIISITRAGNNLLQSLSDVNFYVFAEPVAYHRVDITSRVSMIVLTEMIVYSLIAPEYVTLST